MSENTGKPYQDFKSAFDEYYNPLCNYANSFLKDTEASEDIVQDVFIRIWEKRQDLISAGTLRFYLFTAIRNNCLTYLQKQKKSVVEPLKEQGVDHFDIDREAIKENDYKALLTQSIALLPPKCREVFLLSRISKLSYQQIAESQGISIKTVENQIGKALRVIREFLKDKNVFTFLAVMLNLFVEVWTSA